MYKQVRVALYFLARQGFKRAPYNTEKPCFWKKKKKSSPQKGDNIISQSCGGFPHYMEAKGCFHFEYSSLPESETQLNWRVNVRWKKEPPPQLSAKIDYFS